MTSFLHKLMHLANTWWFLFYVTKFLSSKSGCKFMKGTYPMLSLKLRAHMLIIIFTIRNIVIFSRKLSLPNFKLWLKASSHPLCASVIPQPMIPVLSTVKSTGTTWILPYSLWTFTIAFSNVYEHLSVISRFLRSCSQ